MNIRINPFVFNMWFGIAIAATFALSLVAVQQADGHGVGYELLPPVWLEDRQVSLEVSSSRYDDVDNPNRQIRFALMDSESLITIRDVTYGVSAYKGDIFLMVNLPQKMEYLYFHSNMRIRMVVFSRIF